MKLEIGEIYIYANDTSVTYSAPNAGTNIYHANIDMKVLEKTFYVNFRSHRKVSEKILL